MPISFKDPEALAQSLATNANQSQEQILSQQFPKSFSALEGVASDFQIVSFDFDKKEIQSIKQSSQLMAIDSQTKTFTSCALLRATEEQGFKDYIPSLEKPLADFLELLKKHYPDSSYIQNDLQQDPNFAKITLKDLLLHTSGLLRVKKEYFPSRIIKNSYHQLSSEEKLDAPKVERTNCFGQNHNEYSYNNIDYELAKSILMAVANEISSDKKNFSEVVENLVVSKVREKLSNHHPELVEKIKLFTSDQFEFIDGKPTLKDWSGEICDKEKFFLNSTYQALPSYLYDNGSGGAYARADALSIMMFYCLNNEKDLTIFKEQKTLDLLNQTLIEDPQNKTKKIGLGFFTFSSPYDYLRHHEGSGYGSCSSTYVNLKDKQSYSVVMTFDNLVLPIAYALNLNQSDEKITQNLEYSRNLGLIKLDENLLKNVNELKAKFSEEQLVKLRIDLEKAKSIQDFTSSFKSEQPDKTSPNIASPRIDSKGRSR